MREAWIIFCKEMRKLFTSPRMVISLYLPGIILFVVYSLMGEFMTSSLSGTTYENTEFVVAYTNNYGSSETHTEPYLMTAFSMAMEEEGKGNTVKGEAIEASSLDEYKVKLEEGSIDLLVQFSDDFDLTFIDVTKKATNTLNFFYDGSKEKSSYCYSLGQTVSTYAYVGYLENYDAEGNYIQPNVSTDNYLMTQIMASLFPMVTVSLLFSTLIAICPESVAGEKERGTLAALLLTPSKRWSIALGKMMSLSVAAITSGAVSFLGTAFSMPSVMGISGSIFTLWSASDIVLLFFLIASAMLLFLALSLLISCLCKTVKEASAYMTPAMVLLMMLSFTPMLMDVTSLAFAFIPGFNVLCSMNLLIFGTSGLAPYLLVTILTNVVAFGALLFLCGKCFQSERLMLKR